VTTLRPCIWGCGRVADSDEDVLAQWIREYLGAKTGRKNWELRDLTPVDSVVPTTDNPRTGPRRAFQVIARNIVCQRCNNGWMSEVQQAAKPTLLSMFEGQSVQLGPSGQAVVLSWCTMTAICNQYAHGLEVDESRRAFFYKHRMPPTYTLVVMAHIPEPDMDTMHATSGWRERLSKRSHAYFDLFAIKQLAVLILSGWLPPSTEAVIRGKGIGVTLRPTHDLASSIRWPGSPTTTKAFLDLYERVFTSLREPP
jgi:hypothetical protein